MPARTRVQVSIAIALLGAAALTNMGHGTTAAHAAAQSSTISLASHRAVYDLKLSSTRGKRSMTSVHGRILYDFSGSACEGYALQFRQVSELDNGEGKVVTSDLRATSWEEGAGKLLRFHSKNYFESSLREAVDGQAEKGPDGVAVKLTEPAEKTIQLSADVAFPTEHIRRIIAAAREGKSLLQAAVYDGSDSGEKLYDTLAIIGKAIPPNGLQPADVAAAKQAFSALSRWPVTISYFDRAAGIERGGEQTPVYAITFELYENGVSRALLLDYGDFVLSGEMTAIEIKDSKPCQ
jgi:EipB-like